MSLHKYTGAAWDIALMFRSSLSSDDVTTLRDDLIQMGEGAWLAWEEENQGPIISLLSNTPAQIAKRKDWKDPLMRPRIAFAAYRQARLAARVLSAREQLGPGGGYRETCRSAAHEAQAILAEARWFWPFDGEPPFPGWEPPDDYFL